MTKYITDAWLVIVLGLAFGAALAGVQMGLGPIIDQNKLNEALSRIPALVPGAVQPDLTKVSPDQVMFREAGSTVYYARDERGRQVGWVIQAAGQGFADRIELLIGVNQDAGRITGLYVLEHKESPGYGDRIATSEFQDPFNKGKIVGGEVQRLRTDQPLKVTAERTDSLSEVKALTGATISSQSVAGIINDAMTKVRPGLRARAGSSGAAIEPSAKGGR